MISIDIMGTYYDEYEDFYDIIKSYGNIRKQPKKTL